MIKSFAPPISIKHFPAAVLGREWACKRTQESEVRGQDIKGSRVQGAEVVHVSGS